MEASSADTKQTSQRLPTVLVLARPGISKGITYSAKVDHRDFLDQTVVIASTRLTPSCIESLSDSVFESGSTSVTGSDLAMSFSTSRSPEARTSVGEMAAIVDCGREISH